VLLAASAIPDAPSRALSDELPAPEAPQSLPVPPPLSLQLPAIDALVQEAIAQGKLPGAVIAVGRSTGVVWQRAYGSRALLPAREPMTLDPIFDIA